MLKYLEHAYKIIYEFVTRDRKAELLSRGKQSKMKVFEPWGNSLMSTLSQKKTIFNQNIPKVPF